MADKIKKKDQIKQRRVEILQYLATCADGRAGYDLITEKLNVAGYNVGQRTIRNDCKELMEQGFVVKIKKGVAITEKAKLVSTEREEIEEGVREKYLKQLAILKSLYACERRSNSSLIKGLLPKDIARLGGIGRAETVEDILQQMAREGLVQQNNGRWRLGVYFSPPIQMESYTAGLLYEYLSAVADLVPLPADLAVLKSKLAPLFVMPQRQQWRENIIKQTQRIIVHGRGGGDHDGMHQVLTLLEKSVHSCRAVNCIYRGRAQLLYPLGIVYHWHKGQWYLIAQKKSRRIIVSWPLNRFSQVQISSETFNKPSDFSLEKYLAKRWGISDDQELNVVIHFKNTNWHPMALEKLKADLSRRLVGHGNCNLVDQQDGSAVLYDQIQGQSEFARWLRSYGDAARVLKPASLRLTMYETGQKMLARYGRGVEDNE